MAWFACNRNFINLILSCVINLGGLTFRVSWSLPVCKSFFFFLHTAWTILCDWVISASLFLAARTQASMTKEEVTFWVQCDIIAVSWVCHWAGLRVSTVTEWKEELEVNNGNTSAISSLMCFTTHIENESGNSDFDYWGPVCPMWSTHPWQGSAWAQKMWNGVLFPSKGTNWSGKG